MLILARKKNGTPKYFWSLTTCKCVLEFIQLPWKIDESSAKKRWMILGVLVNLKPIFFLVNPVCRRRFDKPLAEMRKIWRAKGFIVLNLLKASGAIKNWKEKSPYTCLFQLDLNPQVPNLIGALDRVPQLDWPPYQSVKISPSLT